MIVLCRNIFMSCSLSLYISTIFAIKKNKKQQDRFTQKQSAVVFGAIPNGVIMLFKGYNSALASSEMSLPDPVDTCVGGICFKSTLKNNRNIRFLFLNDYVSTPQAVSKWNRSVENILWKKVWTLPNRYLLVNKVKEISFKRIHQ